MLPERNGNVQYGSQNHHVSHKKCFFGLGCNPVTDGPKILREHLGRFSSAPITLEFVNLLKQNLAH